MSVVDTPETPIWLRAQHARPGPRPRHTLDEIADVAIRIVDTAGLGALSMRGVAGGLGTGPASLYRYVSGKADLENLMVDRIAGGYVYPPLTGDVRDDVLAVLDQVRAAHRQRPWLTAISAAALGPNSVRLLDRMVAALGPLHADAGSTMLGIALLSGWAMNFGGQEAAGASTDPVRRGADLAMLVDADQHPHLAALLTAGTGSGTAPLDVDDTFRRGVQNLLAGVEAHARDL